MKNQMKEKKVDYGLCLRCEHRIQYHIMGFRPRFECGLVGSIYSCYMYRPVKPFVIKKNKGDRRPLSPAMLAARVHAVCVPADLECVVRKHKDGYIFYWVPKEKENESKSGKSNPKGSVRRQK